jgi:hypothetical protein
MDVNWPAGQGPHSRWTKNEVAFFTPGIALENGFL